MTRHSQSAPGFRARDIPGLDPGTHGREDLPPAARLTVVSTTEVLPIGFRTIDGVRVRCAESKTAHERSVLLTSPWPESVHAFDRIWSSLAEHARLVAIDLPGFGQSERRQELLSPRAMGEFLVRVIDEMDLRRPHIVAPDVGTAAALFAAAGHPDEVASLVVGTGATAVPLQLGEPLASWVFDPDLDKYRAMDARAIVSVAIGRIEGGVADEVRADYLDSYAGDRLVESMRYVRRYPEELPQLADLLPGLATPVLIINGRHDPVVPLANAEFLHERLPNSRLAIIDAAHFVWEEAPVQYASLIIDWITGDGR
jgi:pimeloyl-ACP methyl ester carboxylesterase